MNFQEIEIVSLITAEGCEIKVERSVIEASGLIRRILSDLGHSTNQAIPLPNVSAPILEKVIEYCKHHKHVTQADLNEDKHRIQIDLDKMAADYIAKPKDEWDTEFCKTDQATLLELIMAANYLDIQPLIDLTCYSVACLFKGKSPEELRETFGVDSDLTEEDENYLKSRNAWCFDE
ncbi:hypothetical protein BB559_003186 [Furculomyces boomerangus]|uniref:E3 ubiquitin ligase complex SCF subunit n=2 Tax=Harpellales TaxID=61421 RepID=A0A2T9Y340_9FUNG|nr:hypothetical protein BB559_006408 [Furculomyces boomerangus]PVU93726.1 hypothetical protein BB559_003186 [Furculomyces boomerangus]PWA00845.1 hypothetical protein BB558_003078 [Smittium angustum]